MNQSQRNQSKLPPPSPSSPATDISPSPSFTFQKPILSIDWRALHAINLDTAVDLSQLERGLPSLVLGDIQSERVSCLTPLNIVCAFRTAQFALQYLLQVQDQLTKQLMEVREEEATIRNSNKTHLKEQQRLLLLYKGNKEALKNKLHVMQIRQDALTAELLTVKEQMAEREKVFAAKLELAKRSGQNHSRSLEGELSRVMSENLRLRRRVAEMAVAGGTTDGRQQQQRKSDDGGSGSGVEKADPMTTNSQQTYSKNAKHHPVPSSPTRKQQYFTTTTTSPEVITLNPTTTEHSSADKTDTDLDQDHCIEQLKTMKKKNLDSQNNAFYRPLHRGSEALTHPPTAAAAAAAAATTTSVNSIFSSQQTKKTAAPDSDQWKSLRNSVSIKRAWHSPSETNTHDDTNANSTSDNDDDEDVHYNSRHSVPWAISDSNVLTPEKRHPMPYLKNGTGSRSNSMRR